MSKVVPTPGEMRDIDVNFLSLVRKGANGQQISIYKADDEEGEAVPSFAATIAVSEITSNMYRVNDTLCSTMRAILANPKLKDKKSALESTIDEYAAYMKKRIGSADITKSDEFFDPSELQPVEKSGRKVSGKNLAALKGALEAIQGILSEAENVAENNEGGEETSMKKEDLDTIQKAVSAAVQPLADRLDKIENGEAETPPAAAGSPPANGTTVPSEPSMADIVKSAIEEAMKPLNERIASVEKSRGISASAGAVNDVHKADDQHYMHGIF